MIPPVICDIALRAARDEYAATRRLGGSPTDATIAGMKVMLDVRKIASSGSEITPAMMPFPDSWWAGP